MFKKFCLFSFLLLSVSLLRAEDRFSYEYILNAQYNDATKTLKISPYATSIFNVTGSTVSNVNLTSLDVKTVVVNTKDVAVTSGTIAITSVISASTTAKVESFINGSVPITNSAITSLDNKTITCNTKDIAITSGSVSVTSIIASSSTNKTEAFVNGMNFDSITGAIINITQSHQKVHEGNHFMCTDFVELGSGASTYYLITTSDTTKWAHMIFELDGSAITEFALYGSSDRVGTTLVSVGNNNRNSLTVNQTLVHRGVSGGTTDGVLLHYYKGGSATNQSRVSMQTGNNEEIILKQNTKYILLVKSSTASNLTNIKLEWYEHTNR